jgi:hypothetical protein
MRVRRRVIFETFGQTAGAVQGSPRQSKGAFYLHGQTDLANILTARLQERWFNEKRQFERGKFGHNKDNFDIFENLSQVSKLELLGSLRLIRAVCLTV